MHSILTKTCRGAAIISLACIIFCQDQRIVDVSNQANLESVIQSEYKRFEMPGIAYAAIKGDSVVHIGAQGYADRQAKTPFTPHTRMLIASISKTMVVTAIMQLYEKGTLSLEKDINNYLPFTVRNPGFPNDSITVKMLLTHTSSISDKGYLYSMFYLYGYVDYPEALMGFAQNYLTQSGRYFTGNNFLPNKPGSQYSYSDIGATLLACIVEYVSGTDFSLYCTRNIFQPLGMTKTTWFFKDTPKEELAIPYADNAGFTPSNPFFSYPDYPDGHLMTTVEDLSKFLRAYIMKGAFNNYQLLKAETVDIMLRNIVQVDAVTWQGLIFINKKIGNDFYWGHDGDDMGVSTEMAFDPQKGIGCIQFTNRWYAHSMVISEALLRFAQNQ